MSKSVVFNVALPVSDLMRKLEPFIQAEVAARVQRSPAAVSQPLLRTDPSSIDEAISNVTRALTRVENSQNSRDEIPATKALVAAATALRRVHEAIKDMKGQ